MLMTCPLCGNCSALYLLVSFKCPNSNCENFNPDYAKSLQDKFEIELVDTEELIIPTNNLHFSVSSASTAFLNSVGYGNSVTYTEGTTSSGTYSLIVDGYKGYEVSYSDRERQESIEDINQRVDSLEKRVSILENSIHTLTNTVKVLTEVIQKTL